MNVAIATWGQGRMPDSSRDRNDAETKLLAAHEFLQSVIDALSAHVAVLDSRGVIVLVNRAWCDFADANGLRYENHGLGYSYLEVAESATGLWSESGPAVAEALRQILDQRRDDFYIEYPCHHTSQDDPQHVIKRRWFQLRAGRFSHEDQAWVITAHENVTELKLTEQALRRAERLASIGTLAAGIAHEVNNPLHGIVLYSEAARLAKDTPDAGATRDELLQKIQDEAMRCGRLVRSVLQFARQEASQKWPGTIDRIVRQSCDLALPMAGRHRVKIDIDLPEHLPPVHLNPTEMQQVFVNLIQNAIQASKPGGRVVIGASADHGNVSVQVRDFGRGMSPEQQQQMFDPFYTTRQQHGGAGLGLSISHGIICDHGGSVEVSSALGQGTTVTVTLPCSPHEGVND